MQLNVDTVDNYKVGPPLSTYNSPKGSLYVGGIPGEWGGGVGGLIVLLLKVQQCIIRELLCNKAHTLDVLLSISVNCHLTVLNT